MKTVSHGIKQRISSLVLLFLSHQCAKIREEAVSVLLRMICTKENISINEGAFYLIVNSDIFGYILTQLLDDLVVNMSSSEIVIQLLELKGSKYTEGKLGQQILLLSAVLMALQYCLRVVVPNYVFVELDIWESMICYVPTPQVH